MKSLRTDFKGIVTAPGILSRAEASCVDAVNCVVDAPGVMRKRKGFERGDQSTGGNAWKVFSSREMSGNVLVHQGGPLTGTVLKYGDGFDGSGALASVNMVGTSNLTRTLLERMDMAVGGLAHYLTADEGVARIESTFDSATQHFAGMPRGMSPITGTLTSSLAAGTTLADGYARAYRVTWHRIDSSGVELGGAPTDRSVIRNQTGNPNYGASAKAARCYFFIPEELGVVFGTALTTSYFWRLWGTHTFNSAGGEQGDDEMYLIAERYLTAGEISTGAVVYTDNTPDSYLLKQRRLHTNITNFPESELGVAQGTANEDAPPPIASRLSFWNDVMWYGGCEYRSRLQLQLLTISNNNTVRVEDANGNAVTLTAKTVPAGPTDFQIFSAYATTQLNLEATSRALVEAINLAAYGAANVRAYYVSVNSQSPGYIYFESTCIATGGGAGAVNVTSSNVSAFTLMDATGYALGTTDSQPNALAFSKPLRPDAVPPINAFTVGPRDSRILRLQAYRDKLLVFTDYGIYQCVGKSFEDFAVFPFDLGYRLLAPEAVAVCDERVYAWCYEGIIEITDGGINVVSLPIEPSIIGAMKACGDASGAGFLEGQQVFVGACFAVAYRQTHTVQFWYPEAQSDTDVNGCPYWFSFDTRTRAWSRGWLTKRMAANFYDTRNCGVVRFSDDLLVLGNWSDTTSADWFLFKERRDFGPTDYTDDYSDGTSGDVSMAVTFQYEVPEADGAVHWQQTVVEFDGNEFTWRPIPTAVALTWTLDPTSITQNDSLSGNTLSLVRFETPQACRRGNRLRVTLVSQAGEYFGLVGLAQTYRDGTRFAQRSAS